MVYGPAQIRELNLRHATALAELERERAIPKGHVTCWQTFDESQKQLEIALRERDEARATNNAKAYYRKLGELLAAESQLTSTKAALAEERELIRKLITDSTYEGGTQYWIAKHGAVMLAFLQSEADRNNTIDALAAKQQECVELREKLNESMREFNEIYTEVEIHREANTKHEEQLTAALGEQLAHENTRAELADMTANAERERLNAKAATQRAESAEKLADELYWAIRNTKWFKDTPGCLLEVFNSYRNLRGTTQARRENK